MRKDITVAAQSRTSRGKNEARRQRVQHLSPAVLYGAGKEALPVTVSPKDVDRILRSASGHNTIFNLDVQGVENTPVMIVDAQRDPIKSSLLHVDLLRIDLSKPLVVSIPVHLTGGDPKGVKLQGGTLEVVTREISVECLPDEIPEHLTANVAEMMVGDALRAGQVALSGSMKLVGHAEQVIAHVVGMKAEEPAADAAAAGPAEPEVIKKGKKDEEGAPAGKDAKAPAAKAPAAKDTKAPAKDAKKK